MPAPVMAASFQNVKKAFDIGIHIGMGMLQRIADAGLRREMDDDGKAVLRKQRLDGVAIGQIEPGKAETRVPAQYCETRFLQRGVVIMVDDIEADHRPAVAQQPLRDVEADEPGRSGNQDRSIRHRRSVSGLGS